MSEAAKTGYPSIDKPWMKYYEIKLGLADIPFGTCYEVLAKSCSQCLDDTAIDYFGTNIKYRDLLAQIEQIASAFASVGVASEDVVSIVGVKTPELIYAFYAANRIGAVVDFIDPRLSPDALCSVFKGNGCKVVMCMDACMRNAVAAAQRCGIKTVIRYAATDSLSKPKRMLLRIASIGKGVRSAVPLDSLNALSWQSFVSGASVPAQIAGTAISPACIVHTSGSTGIPKMVVLSNRNMNAALVQVGACPISLKRKSTFLDVIVPFVAFGSVLAMHVPLCLGWKTFLTPKFDINEFAKRFMEVKPNAVMGVPTYFEQLMKNERTMRADLSFLKAVLGGGAPTPAAFETDFNAFLRERGCQASYSKGWSLTENSSVATCSFDSANKLDSSGVPLPLTVVAAFDETGNELQYGKTGELCIQSPTMMAGYLNDDEATAKMQFEDKRGRIWLKTGDLGYVDEDGFIFVIDRLKRMIIRQGYKVSPNLLEDLIMSHKGVRSCVVVKGFDSIDKEAPVVWIVCVDNDSHAESLESELKTLVADSDLPEYYMPIRWIFVDSLPLTSNGKVDYRELERRAAE